MIPIDLHLHTKFSGDATISPKHVVDQLYAHPFIKGVAVTDHDTLEGYFQVRKLANSYEDVVIIPGVEVSTQSGHVIILGVEEKPAYLSNIEDVIDFAREKAGVIVIPHPYRILGGVGEAAENMSADAIEVINPHSTLKENRMAHELAKARNLPGVAGSDAHEPSEMWSAYTEIDAEPNVDSVLSAIKKGKVRVEATSAKV